MMVREQPSQSISIRNSQLSGEAQVGQAGHDLIQTQQISQGIPEKVLTPVEIEQLLTQFKELVQESTLPESQKEKALKYLDAAKEESQEQEPDKELAAKNLQRATKILKDASETVDASQGLWQKVQPLLTQLLSWLGVAKNFFGL